MVIDAVPLAGSDASIIISVGAMAAPDVGIVVRLSIMKNDVVLLLTTEAL